jgi:hypothetical protein
MNYDAWGQFRNALSAGDAGMTLTIDQTRFPFLFRGASITIIGAQLLATLTDGTTPSALTLAITPPGGEKKDLELVPAAPAGATMLASALLDPPPSIDVTHDTDWMLAAKAGFPIATIRDLILLVTYTAKIAS